MIISIALLNIISICERGHFLLAHNTFYKKLNFLISLLLEDEPLPQKYKDHNLEGEWDSFRECHIKPDWLLIYKKIKYLYF